MMSQDYHNAFADQNEEFVALPVYEQEESYSEQAIPIQIEKRYEIKQTISKTKLKENYEIILQDR